MLKASWELRVAESPERARRRKNQAYYLGLKLKRLKIKIIEKRKKVTEKKPDIQGGDMTLICYKITFLQPLAGSVRYQTTLAGVVIQVRLRNWFDLFALR